jgi:N-carbamoyl-L-amino-acid hydrolase
MEGQDRMATPSTGRAPAPSAERLHQDWDELSRFADPDFDGWTRTVFSEAYQASREFIRGRMEDAGLSVTVDAAGNLVGRLAGRAPGAPALMSGSHTDTVRSGGRFDGVVGVLGAIEVVRALREAGISLQRDLIVVDFFGEETNEFGMGCLGSRALAGDLGPAHFDRTDPTGTQLGQRYTGSGLDPERAMTADWGRREPIHRYVELHVEQGPVLEERGSEIGVVTAIAGIERLLARFAGRQDHAGTMPMGDRRDALVAAAEAVLAIRREGCGAPVHGVATTSRVDSQPGSPNVVPGSTSLHAELRSIDPDWLSSAKQRLAQEISAKAAEYGVDAEIEWRHDNDVIPADPGIQDVVAATADELGLTWEALPSGATHDAAHIARLCPAGMVFVPSQAGRSHCPEEFTSTEHIEKGVRVLASTLVALDPL